jgi:NAD(P)-dependent dehydrogenase (short-subunit alcohol dehydrogenase family)
MSTIMNESTEFSLRGKTVFVAGGTRGIGQAISIRFARAGSKVIANYQRNEQMALQLKTTAENEGLEICLCRADLTSDKGLEQIDQMLEANHQSLDGLVYCAATGIHRSIDEVTERHFDWTFNLNVKAFFKLIKLIKKRFTKGSSVVVVSSWGASRALPHYSLVGSSKGALDALARHLAVELAPNGIRVNILTAGAVLTDAWKAIPNSEERIAETARRTPLGRLVSPDEVASCAQFLCSNAASGIIGHTLVIDGGSGILV